MHSTRSDEIAASLEGQPDEQRAFAIADARWTAELEASVRAAAIEVGFHLCGIAPAGSDASSPQDGDRFSSWVELGRAGDMEYLKRRDAGGTLLRSSLQVAIPWAQSVIVCGLNYDSRDPASIEAAPAGTGWIGRYAWSGRQTSDTEDMDPSDYHDELLGRLRSIEACLAEKVACQTRCYVDTGPIVERDFAAKAGIGWIGKNTCVINQQLGSWLLLAVIVTSLPLAEVALSFAADRCGSCTRCIDACPTNALVAPREMDASRCIAYLTIEKKGEIESEFREAIGRQVFGCDICQDVCPWNKRQRSTTLLKDGGNPPPSPCVTVGMEVRQALVNPSLAWLAAMDSGEFKRWFKGSPLQRTGKKRLQRNVAIAMGNSGQPEFLDQLREWSSGEDGVLAEAARWAMERIQSASIGD